MVHQTPAAMTSPLEAMSTASRDQPSSCVNAPTAAVVAAITSPMVMSVSRANRSARCPAFHGENPYRQVASTGATISNTASTMSAVTVTPVGNGTIAVSSQPTCAIEMMRRYERAFRRCAGSSRAARSQSRICGTRMMM